MTELCADYRSVEKPATSGWPAMKRRAPWLHDQSRRPAHSPWLRSPIWLRRSSRCGSAIRGGAPRNSWRSLPGTTRLAAWPSRSTVCAVLKTRGLVAPPRRRIAPPTPRRPWRRSRRVNETWTTDFKGEFRTGDGPYCYPLTLRDGFSRFVLRCDALVEPNYAATRATVRTRVCRVWRARAPAQRQWGARSPAPACARLSRLSVWWMRLGHRARAHRARPSRSKTDRMSSFIRCSKPRRRGRRRRTREAQQRRFARFCAEYNHERPARGACSDRRAGELLSAARRVPCRPACPPLDYPGHWEIRRVSTDRPRLVARHRPVSVRGARRRIRRLRRSRRRYLDPALRHRRARLATMTVTAALYRLPRSRRGAPPAAAGSAPVIKNNNH